jgi:UDP-N-acetylmuramoyl-L-alanyl-D-glutamate--2,6-diaminopimelate ligase
MKRALQQLLDTIHLPCPPELSTLEITGITADSRKVQPGNLFVAYRGVEVDGHQFIPDAIKRGAVAVVCERKSELGIGNWVSVPNARQTFAQLCAAWHGFPSRTMTVIGVTGTDGKTTTSNLIFSILKAAGHKVGIISTVNAVIGEETRETGLHTTTPDADEVQSYLSKMREVGATHCVLEVTSHGLAQYRVDGTDFDIAVVTNITHEHLDLHGTREAYRGAKARLFEMANTHVLNVDDDYSFAFLARLPAQRRLFYSREVQPSGNFKNEWLFAPRADFIAGEIQAVQFNGWAQIERMALPLKTNLIGDFNVSNVLAACATAIALGIPREFIQHGVASLEGVAGRMERIDEGQSYLAVVDFAHTPNALDNCLHTLRKITPGKLIAVFGCAGERDKAKRALMGKIAADLADVIVFTAEDPRRESLDDIIDEMERGAKQSAQRVEIHRVHDRGEAIRFACSLAKTGDTVVACGKGHEQSMCFGTQEFAWDDRKAMRLGILGKRLELGN